MSVESLDREWREGVENFTLYTSGSTGVPKPQVLQRDLLIWSAQQTQKHFIRSSSLKQLIALPLNKAGGFMQWVRSKVWQSEIEVIEPSSNPMLSYQGDACIVSLTPHQLFHILESFESVERLSKFETVLIGGAPLSANLENRILTLLKGVHLVHTFGMTETYSHFAGRTLGETHYRCIDQTSLRTDANEQLEINNPTTQNHWLNTRDKVELTGNNTFIWKGRSDFTINSGGIKIQLEEVEAQISEQFQLPENSFCCWFEENEALGQMLIMILKYDAWGSNIVSNLEVQLKEKLNLQSPKKVYVIDQLIFTESGKIDRRSSFQYIRFC